MPPDIDDLPLSSAGRAKTFLFYGGMIAVAAAGFLLVRSAGESLAAPAGNGVASPLAAEQSIDTLFHALLALAVSALGSAAVVWMTMMEAAGIEPASADAPPERLQA